MSTESDMITRLAALQDEAQKRQTDIREQRTAIVQVAKDEGREDLDEKEAEEFDALGVELKTIDDEIVGRSARMAQLAEDEKRAENSVSALRKANIAASAVHVGREGRTYEKGNGNSYFQDLVKARTDGDERSLRRLERHAMEVETEPEYRDITRVDGAGGYFVPPAWLIDLYAPLARAGRPTANLVNQMALPGGTDSINIPLVTTGTATAAQTADNAAVQETDLADSTVAAGVKTIAGQQDVAIQLIEQSPINFDEVIFSDLIADLATKVDVQVLSGSNGSGQVKGIFGATGTNAITYTDTTPTVGELYSKIADAVQQIHTGRFQPPTVIVMHPRRWAWFLAALDSSNRPLVVPNAQGPNNAIGTFGGVASEQVVGSIQGLPVVTDASIPTTIGAGTNEDKIIVMRATDALLWESPVKSRVLPDVGSGTLTVRLQVYSYIAFTAERYPKSISIISGTGLVAPTF